MGLKVDFCFGPSSESETNYQMLLPWNEIEVLFPVEKEKEIERKNEDKLKNQQSVVTILLHGRMFTITTNLNFGFFGFFGTSITNCLLNYYIIIYEKEINLNWH